MMRFLFLAAAMAAASSHEARAAGPGAAGEAWTPDRLNSFFDGAKAAPGPVEPAAAEGTQAVPHEPEASAPKPAGAVPEGSSLHLAGPDEGAKAPPSPVQSSGKVPPLDDIPGSDWRTVGHIEDSVSDANPSAREKQDFWDKLRNGAFWNDISDQVCKNAKIPVKYNLRLGDHIGTEPRFERYLRTGVDGKMVLVDRAELGLRLGYGVPVLQTGTLGVSVSAGTEIRGMSWVIRPLKGAKACQELDELVDLRHIKFVYPLEADRFAGMEVGELWAMPLILRATFGVGASYPVAGVAPVGVSWGYSREGGTNVTIRRVDKDTLRVRIRIDHARVTGPAIGLDYTITGNNFYQEYTTLGRELASDSMGDLAGRTVFRLVERPIRRELEKYLAARLQWLTQFIKEDHAVIEFVLDPNDQGQMQGLQELLSGGRLEVIDSLYKRFKTSGMAFWNFQELKDQLPELQETYEAALKELGAGARTFSGANRATSMVNYFRLKFPILFDYKRNAGTRDDRITILDDNGGEYGIYKAHKESESGFIGIPFLGTVFNYNQRRSVMTYVHRDKDGKGTPPGLVFTQQAGYTMHSEDSARSLAVDADAVMRLAGTRGRGVNPRASLPLDKVFPMTPREAREWNRDHPPAADTGPTYDRGMGAFTLVLGEKAISDILNAGPEDVIRSYAAAIDSWDKDAVGWAVKNGTIKADGSVDYDWRKSPYYRPPGGSDDRQNDPEGLVRYALADAKRLVRRLQEIRAMRPDGSSDPEAANKQARALRDIMVGSWNSERSYEDLLKVLVQLTDAKNITAEFLVSAKPKNRKNPVIEGRYLLNKGMEEDPALKALAETSSKFNRPSEYSD